MRTPTTLVHPSTVDREDIVALFLDSAFAFRTTIGHLLPEAAVDDLLMGDLAVVIVRDRCGLTQVVVSDDATRQQLDRLGEETVIRVESTVCANVKAHGGEELAAPTITELSAPAAFVG